MSNKLTLTLLAAGSLALAACSSEPDCSPEQGFELGTAGDEPEALCQERDYAEAWRIGHKLEELRSEKAALEAREDELDARERSRLRRLHGDVPELETLARTRGLMEPAEAPTGED